MKTIQDLASPSVLIDSDKMQSNLERMQSLCTAQGVELWPHIKTHKLIPVLKRQLQLGAAGITCAKIGEAEALLASGVKRIFIAHSLVDMRQIPRLRELHRQLDQLILAVTSELHFSVLEQILEKAEITVSVMMAVDTGLKREGTRNLDQAVKLAEKIAHSSRMTLLGLYTHEGHAYGCANADEILALVNQVHSTLLSTQKALGGKLLLWPGCSATASLMARLPGIGAVRPGAYVFGDLSLSESTQMMDFDQVAINVLATVVDRPEPGLALIDAGSKVFSSDKSAAGLFARCCEDRTIEVKRVNEEHGYLTGTGVDRLVVGQRLRFQPAHVCTVINLASQVHLIQGSSVLERWIVDARGRSD